MRKVTVVLFIFILSNAVYLQAQESFEQRHRHELKFNIGTSVFMAFPEVSYEYILSEDMSVGGAVGFGLGENNGDLYKFKAMPFWRWFFSNRSTHATGFFIEVNGAVGSQNVEKYVESSNRWVSDSMFTSGLGLAVGGKYLSKNNWTAELFAGVGRNFIYDNSYDSESLYSRIGISIGKRF